MKKTILTLLVLAGCAGMAQAQETLKVTMNLATAGGIGKSVGTVTASQTSYGVVLTPVLSGLPPGVHGFHVHQNPACTPGEQDGKLVPALAAGGHYDPAKTGKHEGPYGAGHLGDLPAIFVTQEGTATYPLLAPRLKLSDLKGRSLMIHAGGDNHSDHPQKLGGGGARVACGVIAPDRSGVKQ
ncbi:MAG: superoxide dismutase family protein [Steroidobacteraceae bacterium]|nr:superoxide dismutase family protein [Deltaproteobacteria bacterium]